MKLEAQKQTESCLLLIRVCCETTSEAELRGGRSKSTGRLKLCLKSRDMYESQRQRRGI